MGGINTDEKMIIEIFCNHSYEQVPQYSKPSQQTSVQRERIQKAYNNLGSKDLLSDLKVLFGRLDNGIQNNL